MKNYNPKFHHRRSIRLKGYDYSQEGIYFITICCQGKICLFGEVVNGEIIMNDAGQLIKSEWLNLKIRFPNIELHAFVVMPNHFHAILEIKGAPLMVSQHDYHSLKGQPQGVAPTNNGKNKSIGNIIDAYKSITTV